jgi:hypothetical protein
MMAVNVELRNYGVEIAICDYESSTPGWLYQTAFESEMKTAAETWMSPGNAFPWRTRRNAGHSHGLLFDSNMDIVVKDDAGKVLDQFKGSECMDLTYVYKEYSAVPYKRYRGHNVHGRITAMEITQNGYQRSRLPISPHQYSRDLIHIGLSKVNHIVTDDENGWYLHSSKAFIVDQDTNLKSTVDNNKTHSVNTCIEEIKIHGPTYQKVIVQTYGYNPPKIFTEANAKDCDSLYKYIISKGEFK